MAEARSASSGTGSTGAGGAPGGGAPPAVLPALRRLWPIPALVLALGLFGGGLAVAFTKRPKPDPTLPLMQARSLVETQQFPRAVEFINAEVKPFFDRGLLSPEQEQAYHVDLARAFAGALQSPGYGVPFNHQVVAESFQKAERLGAELAPTDVSLLVNSLLSLGRTDEAIARINRLPDQESSRRTRLIKTVAAASLSRVRAGVTAHSPGGDQQALDLLASLAGSPDLAPEDRAWVLARQAELLMRAGTPEEAINKLIRRIGLLKDVPGEQQGELYMLLGRAYFEADQLAPAAKHLEIAESHLPPGSPLRAETGLLLGRIAQARGVLDQARERFQGVMGEFGTSDVYPRALLGLAEVLAANRETPADQQAALERYAELADLLKRPEGLGGEVTRESAVASLTQRFDERAKAGLSAEALRFAVLAESMYTDNEVPAPILLGIGQAHRDLGDALLGQARAGAGAEFRIEDLDAATRAEVKHEYLDAGQYLRRHAQRMASVDQDAYAQSLWAAGDSFDLAGDLDEARTVFQQYADGGADNDPNKPAAKFRLAQVCQAQRDYPVAEAILAGLVEGRAHADARTPAGRWGERAVVPLAQCYLLDGDGANDAEAERLLTSVVEGSMMSPDAAGYRDALIELGTMNYTGARYPEAIARLEQAVRRYPEDRRAEILRYRLADSHRLEAGRVRATLGQALPQSQRDELEGLRVEHLKAGRAMFGQVCSALGGREPARLTALEKVCLRNAYFYIGDCAFELGDFDGAVAAYDTARLRYADDPASLVAMAQIVSAYAAQERWAEARTANERARQQLARFPESVWSRTDLPMEKRHWERWLDARTQLEQMAGEGEKP